MEGMHTEDCLNDIVLFQQGSRLNRRSWNDNGVGRSENGDSVSPSVAELQHRLLVRVPHQERDLSGSPSSKTS